MIVRNLTRTNLSFEVAGRRYHLGPKGSRGYTNDTSLIDSSAANDPTIQYMQQRGMLVVEDSKMEKPELPQKTVQVVEQKDVEQPKTVEVPTSGAEPQVMKVVKDIKAQKHVVTCAATTVAGKPCTSKVYVEDEEYDPDKPYFCNRHKAQKAEDYVRTETGWKKK